MEREKHPLCAYVTEYVTEQTPLIYTRGVAESASQQMIQNSCFFCQQHTTLTLIPAFTPTTTEESHKLLPTLQKSAVQSSWLTWQTGTAVSVRKTEVGWL